MRKTLPVKPAAEMPATFDLFSETPAPVPALRPARPAAVKAAPAKEVSVKAPPVQAAPVKEVPAKVAPAPAKAAPPRAAKKIPVRAGPSAPAPVRVVAETPATYFCGEGGRAWRMSGKHAVAYVRDAALAGELLATEPRHLAKSAMAVYYDRKGKPFAWQLRFDSARWDEVLGRLA